MQHALFDIGGECAIPGATVVNEDYVALLERALDRLNEDLPPLKEFILPGGGPAAVACHLARAVCRRAERLTVACAGSEAISELTIKYLNRLSDFLFMLGRFENFKSGKGDIPWIPK